MWGYPLTSEGIGYSKSHRPSKKCKNFNAALKRCRVFWLVFFVVKKMTLNETNFIFIPEKNSSINISFHESKWLVVIEDCGCSANYYYFK